jgi:hypothetical protein
MVFDTGGPSRFVVFADVVGQDEEQQGDGPEGHGRGDQIHHGDFLSRPAIQTAARLTSRLTSRPMTNATTLVTKRLMRSFQIMGMVD